MLNYIFIAIGSALGGVARYGLSRAVALRYGDTFPWGTLVVNVVGSWVIGLFAALTAAMGPLGNEPAARQLVIVGLCGGYTTFSSFSLQTLNLSRGGEWLSAAANTLASVVLCYLAAWLGFVLGGRFG